MEGISVVISTLGGPELNQTIQSLNQGTLIPKEIILSLPSMYKNKIDTFQFKNVRIIESPQKGQVFQRCFGFQQANQEFVLQSDDDVIYEPNCLEFLIKSLKSSISNSCVAPQCFLLHQNKYAYRLPNFRDRYLAFFANGFQGFESGCISKSGINFGFLPIETNEVKKVDWLPGGCILHRKENLVLENFYPFSGKAYAEDLFHCMQLRKKGIQFFICPNARIHFEWSSNSEMGLVREIKEVIQSFKALWEYSKQDKRNRWMLFFYFFNSILTAPLKKWMG